MRLAGVALLALGCSGSNFSAEGTKGGSAGMAGSAAGLGGVAGDPQGGAGVASGGSPAGQGGMAAGSAGEAAGGPATGGAGLGGESAVGGLGGAGAGQVGGSAGKLAAGMGGAGGAALPCDVREALQESCARVGCHRSPDATSGLDLSQMDRIAEQMVDVHATHGGIACNGPGEPFRECTQEELTGCSWGAYRVDSQNFQDSWVVLKMMGNQGQCGGQMPQPPGNSEANGWSPERRACLLAYFQSLTR